MNAFLKLMLKGSAVSAMALTMAAVGCSDDDKDTKPGAGGESGGGKAGSATSGTTNGGDPGTDGGTGGVAGGAGPTDNGGASGADAGGAGGAAGANGISVARFCNDLTFGTQAAPMDTTLILEIGTGADKVTFTATTGECAPADGAACSSIVLGPDVPVALFDADDTTQVLYEGSINSEAGDNWIFFTDLSADDPPSPIAQGQAITNAACEDITFDDVYPPPAE